MTDAGVAAIVTGMVTVSTMIVGFLTLWVKLRYGASKAEEAATKVGMVEAKIDTNTELTREAGTAAKKAADKAENAAVKAEDATAHKVDILHDIQRHVNCGLAAAVNDLVEPMRLEMEAHMKQDAQNMELIAAKLSELTEYVHQRNHDILNAIQTNTNNVALLRQENRRTGEDS